MICETLGLFVNRLTADEKFSFRNRENVRQPIETQLSKKQKRFSQFFADLLKSQSNFEHFEKKDYPHSSCISEITEC